MKIREEITVGDVARKLDRVWELSGRKLLRIREDFDVSLGAPVFTREGRYTTRGWTDWTQGFQFGSEILQFDATGERGHLEYARDATFRHMAPHVTHTGVHDHGFNNVSTYGALRRLCLEGRIDAGARELEYYELALKVSGAVQAARWSGTADGGGYIHSFNGPHSLFVDTIRTVRVLALADRLGHALLGEHDERLSLLGRLVQHGLATARYNIYYGEGRDRYDVWGRTAHEAIFNRTDGRFRCPSSQQGYSPFSTWTRGLAWAMLGFAEELEFLETADDAALEAHGGRADIEAAFLRAARATCDFYIANTASDGIPYWDTGAPQLHRLGDYTAVPADPFNPYEPVDSSAAAIGAQGLLRLGRYLERRGDADAGRRYWLAGLTVADTLFQEPYLSTDPDHQGLLLHSVYHHPNGWDHVPAGRSVPSGESSMWGDYHCRELALYIGRVASGGRYYTFFGG